MLSAKVPPMDEPVPEDPLSLTPKEYRLSAAYLQATEMPTLNLLEIANYALNPTSAEMGRKLVEARAALAPGALIWSMEPRDIVRERMEAVEEEELNAMSYLETELENLTINNGDPNQIVKTKLRLKKLALASKQRQLREQVLVHLQLNTRLDTQFDTQTCRRNKRQSMKEPRLIERALKEHRVQVKHAQTKRTSDEFLKKLATSVTQMSTEVKVRQQKYSRVFKAVAHYHAAAEKEEQKRQERLAKERIRALRADDEEAYLRLIDQEKDTRLTHLLKQTDEFLDNLTARVTAQKLDLVLESDMTEDVSMDHQQQQKDYYQTAHQVKEEIAEQPMILTGGKLKEYQLKGLQWLVSLYNNNLNGILADEMGLGKTIQAISLISYLMEKKGQSGPFLIIVPLSTITNWVNEFEKWAPSIVKVEYKGSQANRKAAQAVIKQGKFNVLITTYEYVIKDRPFLCKFKWLHMIIDEGHRMKNTESKLVCTLTQYYSSRFRLILTGTPLQNNLPELWALLNFILPKIFNSSKTFEEWFNAPFANTGERVVELNEEETLLIIRRLHKVLRPFLLRRMKKDVEGELPDKIERVIKCPMSALQQRLYAIVKKQASSDNQGNFVGMRRLNNTIMQLRKICNHPFVFEEVEDQVNPTRLSNELLWRVAGKFELLHKLLPKIVNTNHRVLIFFQMTQVMTIMEDFLTHSLGLKYLRLDGSTKAEDRSELLKQFNAKDSVYPVFLLSTRAGGLGLNLQSADTVIIFDSDWNPHQDLQAQDRAHRIGQTKEVRIFRLITADSVEEYILERAQFKLSLDGKVIQAGKFDHKSTNEEREAMLRALMDGSGGMKTSGVDCNDEEADVYDDEELNEIVARNEEELAVFRRMDDERKHNWAGRSRLIEEKELPVIYKLEEDAEITTSSEQVQSRKRAKVNYDESMSDHQWLRKLDREGDASDSEEEDAHGSTPQDDERWKMNMILDKLDNMTQDNRQLSEIFRKLPSARQYPDYYKIIRKPISMNEIRKKIPKMYPDMTAFADDLRLMYSNAMTYNPPGSWVYEDAVVLLGCLEEMLASMDGDFVEGDAGDDGCDAGDSGDDSGRDNGNTDSSDDGLYESGTEDAMDMDE